MAEVGSAFVSILPSARGFGRSLDSAITPGVTASGKKAGKSWGGTFGSAIKGTLAGLGIAKLGGEAVRFLGDSLSEGREAEKVGQRTEGVIKSMGLQSKVTAGQIGDLSTEISNKTGIDDEAIQKTANLLLGFKSLGDTAGQVGGNFEQATGLATDMAAALDKDAKSGAIQLGRALNDPVKGMTALTRVGVTFTDQQQDQIKKMVANGDTLGAQGVILDEVSKKFGGAAEQMANPSEKARVAVDNLKEQIGTGLIPVVNTLATFASGTLIPAISSFVSVIGKVAGFINQNRTAVTLLVGALTALIVVTKIHTAFLAVQAAGGLVSYLKGTKLVAAATRTWTAVQWLMNAALTANPIGLVIAALVLLGAGLIIAWKKSETFRKVVKGALEAVQGAFKWLAGKVSGFVSGFGEKLGNAVDFVKELPGKIKGVFSDAASFLVSAGADIVRGLIDGIKSMAGAAADAAIGVVKDALDKAKGFLKIGSPSKVWAEVGEWSMLGLARGTTKGGKKAQEAIEAQLDQLKDKLKGFKDAAKSLADSVAQAFTQDAFGGGLADFIKVTTGNIASLTAMKAALAQIKSFGASDSFIKALFSSGNTALISQLAAGGAGAVANAQSLFAQQNSLGAELGSSVASTVLGDEIRGVRKEIRELRKDLRKAGRDNAREFARVLNGTAAAAKRSSNERLVVA